MSAISATTAMPSSMLPTSAVPPIDPAKEPAAIRNGNQKAKDAYQTGMAFENVLLNELAQQLSATVPGLDGSDDGLGGTSDGSSTAGSTGGVGGGGGLGAYASLLPQTLAGSVMSGGGTGIAMEIATSLDPALGVPKK
jgi:hypothetical protein